MYAGFTDGRVPPCDTCRVELDHGNEEVAAVYMETRDQVITAGQHNMIVGISIPAIMAVMGLYGVKDQRRCLNMVKRTFHHFNSRSRP
jgi:hypothetical protein